MKTLIIPPEQLRRAVEFAAAAVGVRGSALPIGERPQLEKVLGSACHGPVALQEYLAQLMEIKAAGRLQGKELLLEEIPTQAVIKEGLGVLSDEQLLQLAISPEAIRKLNGVVEQALQAEELGEFWWDAYAVPDVAIPAGYLDDDALRRALEDVAGTPESPETAPLQTSPAATPGAKPRRWSAYAGPILALAACLLVGVAIGWYLHDGGQNRHAIVVANAKVEPAHVRGPNGEKLQQVRVLGPFDGFVVVVALAPDRKQQIIPVFGEDDKPVAKGAESEGIPVPAATTRVLFVVTETPAGEPIRRAFEGKNARRFSPDQEAELRRELEDLLTKKGYRRAAIGSATVVPAP